MTCNGGRHSAFTNGGQTAVPADVGRSSNKETLIEPYHEPDTDTFPKSPFPNRWAMFRAAFWQGLDTLRWLAHVIVPVPVLIYLNKTLGIWFGAPITCAIVALSIFWPPGRFTIFDSVPRAKTLFSVFFGACLLLANTLVMCGVTALIARELGVQGRLILVAGVAGGVASMILSVAMRTPFRELFHIPPDVMASIKDALNVDIDEPSR